MPAEITFENRDHVQNKKSPQYFEGDFSSVNGVTKLL